MGFETRDGKEPLPDEEDIYGVNDLEEQERFESLFGEPTQDERMRRRRMYVRILAILLLASFTVAVVLTLRDIFGWW